MQPIEAEGVNNRANNQGAIADKTPEAAPGEKIYQEAPGSDIYRTLIEQQTVLARIKGEGLDNQEMVVALQTRDVIQAHAIRDACSERLDRLDAKIQSVKEFSRDMKALDRSRQNQRRIEM